MNAFITTTAVSLSSAAATLLLLMPTGAAQAQEGQGFEPPLSDGWRFSVGAGAIVGPKFPGSDDDKLRAVPLLGASYGRYFIGAVPGGGAPVGVGAFLYRDRHVGLGLSLGGGFGRERKESDDARLAGLGDVDGTARASVFGSYNLNGLSLRGNVSTDIGGNDQGTLASLELEARYRLAPSVSLTTGPGLTWADRRYTQTFFGIDAAQSAASGRAQYTPGGGISTLRWSLGVDLDVTRHWKLGARVTAARLQGDAADSPLAFDKAQNSAGLSASYRF